VIFVGALLPILGFIPFDYQQRSNVANHYMYLAMLGVALAGGWIVQICIDRGINCRVVGAMGIALLVGLAADTFYQAGYWRDDYTLFAHNLELEPGSFVANLQMGTHYARVGDHDRAVGYYRRSLAIEPNNPEAHFDLGNALMRQGRLMEAVIEYREALRTWSEHADLHQNLGIALSQLGRLDEARGELEVANRLKPGVPGTLFYLAALAMEQRQDVAEAKKYLDEALRVDPNFAPALGMREQLERFERGR
jgi:tetratricopeptide (TPR) repeat protein